MNSVATAICWIKLHYKKLSLILLALISSIFITACASTHVYSLDIDSMDVLIAVKNTPDFSNCETNLGGMYNTTDDYFISPRCIFKDRAPDTFTFKYVVWYDVEERRDNFFGKQVFERDGGYFTLDGKKVNVETWQALGKENELKAIAQLPDSAWQTYTIDIKEALKRHKGTMPKGTPEGIVIPIGWGIRFPSFLPWLQDRNLSFEVMIDDEANVEVEEKYSWENVLPDNPYV